MSKLDHLKPGDVIAYSGVSLCSRLINWLTGFGPSHVAVVASVAREDVYHWTKIPMVVAHRWSDRLLTFESTTLCESPCVLTLAPIAGVQAHEISDLARYPGRVWRIPLRDPLDAHESQAFTHALLADIGKLYDMDGAILSGTTFLKRLMWWRTMDRNRQYCVELVGSKLLMVLADRGANWNGGELTPKQFVRTLIESRLYGEPERVK